MKQVLKNIKFRLEFWYHGIFNWLHRKICQFSCYNAPKPTHYYWVGRCDSCKREWKCRLWTYDCEKILLDVGEMRIGYSQLGRCGACNTTSFKSKLVLEKESK